MNNNKSAAETTSSVYIAFISATKEDRRIFTARADLMITPSRTYIGLHTNLYSLGP